MDAVTYPDEKVIQFILSQFIPLRVAFDEKPLSDDFNVTWTPTLIVLDSDGNEHHRTTGFLPPEELIPSLVLGTGKACFERGEFAEAIAILEKVLDDYPDSHSAPEAIYFRAVSRYKNTQKADPLKEAYQQLHNDYPTSVWAQRAEPYRLL